MDRRGFLKLIATSIGAVALEPVIKTLAPDPYLSAAHFEGIARQITTNVPSSGWTMVMHPETFKQLVMGLRRQSPMILDNLGIRIPADLPMTGDERIDQEVFTREFFKQASDLAGVKIDVVVSGHAPEDTIFDIPSGFLQADIPSMSLGIQDRFERAIYS